VSDVQLARCVAILRGGGVIAHATEGVWGLACDPFNPAAVARVVQLKGRSERRGFIVIAGSQHAFAAELAELTEPQREQVLTSWPGATTQVLPNVSYPVWVSPHRNPAGFDQQRQSSVALRLTGHPQARALCNRFGGALLSTSANPTGRVAATSALRVRHYFAGSLDGLLPGQVLVPGAASGIRDARTGRWIRQPTQAAALQSAVARQLQACSQVPA